MHAEYLAVFRRLDAVAGRWALLRPAGGRSLETVAGDVDILIDPANRPAAMAALEADGFLQYDSYHWSTAKAVLIRWTPAGLVVLDLHFAVVADGLHYLSVDEVLARRAQDDSLWYLDPADMYLVVLVHDLVGRGAIQAKYFASLRALWPAAAAARDRIPAGLQAIVPPDQATLERWLDSPPALTQALRAALVLALVASSPGNAVRYFWSRHLKRRRRGSIVVFLGPDGSGKSTIAEMVAQWLEKDLRRHVRRLYLGPWGHYWFRPLRYIAYPPPESLDTMLRRRRELRVASKDSLGTGLRLELKRFGGPLTADERTTRMRVRNTLLPWVGFRWLRDHGRYFGYVAVLLGELWARYLVAWAHMRKGRIVVCDRYIYDFLSGEMHGLNSRLGWVRSLACHLYPRPTVAFLLEADPATVVARKDDLDFTTMVAMQQHYRQLATQWRFRPIDANVTPPAVLANLLEHHLGSILARTPRTP